MPQGAANSGPVGSGHDSPILMIDQDGYVWNFWQFNRTSDTTATCSAYGKCHVLNDTGWGWTQQGTADNNWVTVVGAGTAACGASQLGGLLVQAETDVGDIKHALGLAVRTGLIAPGTIAPAVGDDGKTPGAPLKESQLLAIPGNVSMPSSMSPLGQKVFKAFKAYGARVTDDGGGDRTTIRANQREFDQPTMDALRKDMAKLIPLLKLVG
jgi:hypothetical protein